MHRLVIVSSIALLSSVLGCGGDDGGGGSAASGGGDPGSSSLKILFSPMYSAYDGVHQFQLPAIIEGVSAAKWTADPADAVSIEPTSEGVLMTMKRAGVVTITAQAGNLKGTSTLTITNATASDWESGNSRYNNGTSIGRSRDAGPGINSSAACSNCHGETASFADVRHTPQQTGGYSDQDLINIFTNATKPAGVAQRVMSIEEWSRIHKWDMTDAEKKGLIVYLRSLAPKEQDGYNFGIGPRGGMGGPRDGGGFGRSRDASLDSGASDGGV